ncbi:MAG TPA: GMC oxidoreductase [Gaiellaceae bacterium]|nr:GMC oxidoreductase [Gaiellaceae bacterium]
MRHDSVVIGSGPAGVACASALVARGITPLVLDGGVRFDPNRVESVPPPSFDLNTLPLKPIFGSLFPYAPTGAGVRLTGGVGAVPSLAVGGLSTVWGAGILPYAAEDIADWPVSAADLHPHYRAVLGFVPLAGVRDALAERFPLHVEPAALRVTPQIESLLDDLRSNEVRLRDVGVVAGRARLAVNMSKCDYLGLCLTGCPHGAVYSSAHTLDVLAAAGSIMHDAGAVVTRFEETRDGVRLSVRGASEPIVARRVYVACGALPTTRLVLASLEQDKPVVIRDSAYFTFPVLRRRLHTPRVSPSIAGNTLAQVFVAIDDDAVSSRLVHLSVYGFNDLMLRALAARAHVSERVALRVLQPLLARLLFVQGFLHSDESPGMRATMSGDELFVAPEPGNVTPRARAVLAKLRSIRAELGLDPLRPLLRVWPPGKGFHAGAVFPMREDPGPLETDILGRLSGFERVHVVDASVLPTVPGGTITLSVMANAHRIATLADES